MRGEDGAGAVGIAARSAPGSDWIWMLFIGAMWLAWSSEINAQPTRSTLRTTMERNQLLAVSSDITLAAIIHTGAHPLFAYQLPLLFK